MVLVGIFVLIARAYTENIFQQQSGKHSLNIAIIV